MRNHNNIRKPSRMNMKNNGRSRHPMRDYSQLSDQHHYNSSDRQEKIDSRCRHNSQYLRQFVEKYLNFARDSLSSGDRIAAEGFFQHADHYQRLLNEKIQERAVLEKAQHSVVEEQNESRDIHSITPETAPKISTPRIRAKKSTDNSLASTVSHDVREEQPPSDTIA